MSFFVVGGVEVSILSSDPGSSRPVSSAFSFKFQGARAIVDLELTNIIILLARSSLYRLLGCGRTPPLETEWTPKLRPLRMLRCLFNRAFQHCSLAFLGPRVSCGWAGLGCTKARLLGLVSLSGIHRTRNWIQPLTSGYLDPCPDTSSSRPSFMNGEVRIIILFALSRS